MNETAQQDARQGARQKSPKAPKPIVLFVDDEHAILDSIKLNLRRQPYKVLTANSGDEALKVLTEHSVDVVVSDERMPGMNGATLLSEINTRYPDTVRMMLTGQASLEAAVQAINEGRIFRFLSKPINPMDLAQNVELALQFKKLTEQSRKLVATTKAQRSILERLEGEHPGITQVEQDTGGAINVELPSGGLKELMDGIEEELSTFQELGYCFGRRED